MLHANDNSDDELFREAAENYPIVSDNPDWKNLYIKLQSNIEINTAKQTNIGWSFFITKCKTTLLYLKRLTANKHHHKKN